MKIGIIGAGSVGGCLGARLALAGEDITFIARGATLAAIRERGFVLEQGGARKTASVKAAAITDPGRYDLLLLTLKAHQIGAVAPHIMALLAPGAPIVAVQNGIPWWYFHKSGGAFDGRVVEAVDPGGMIAARVDNTRVVGGLIYVAAQALEPGVVRVGEGPRVIIGEPDGAQSTRALAIAEMLVNAGLNASVTSAIRTDIWAKLWGNAAFNPVSALTRATLYDIAVYPPTRQALGVIMAEIEAVAGQFGIRMPMTVDARIQASQNLGRHKTSTLQDIEAGRAPELGAMVGAVAELARLTGVATPILDAIYACASLLAETVVPQQPRPEG